MRFVSIPDQMRDQMDAFTGGREWISIDPKAFGLDAATAGGFNQGSPTSTIGALRGIDDVRRIGIEEIDGTETTHYAGRIDVAKAMASLPEELRANVEAMRAFSDDWLVDVWVDADGQTRKMNLDVNGPMMTMHVTFEFYDFGTDLDLSAPPPSEVVDFKQVFGNLGLGTPSV
jgi:hypothetical protein